MGRLGRPHGVRGAIVVHPETDAPDRFRPGASLRLDDGRSLTVSSVTGRDRPLVVRFAEVGSREEAEALRGSILTIRLAERRPLEPDEFWPDDLVGARVLDPDDIELGTVIGVVEGSAQDRLRVETGGAVVEIPFVAALVPEVDLEAGFVRVAPVEGLLNP